MVISVDHQMASREPMSSLFLIVEVEVVSAKPDSVKKDLLECDLLDADPMVRLVWRAPVNANRLLPTPETG